MKITLVAVGTRMPAWVEAGTAEYAKRLPRDFELNIVEIPLSQRGKAGDLQRAIAREGEAMLAVLDRRDYVAALDPRGRQWSTEGLAQAVDRLRVEGRNLTLLVGGPDGLAPACLERADATWSLSELTLPHPLVRVLVAEQLYRVWSLLNRHPYHRA